MNRREKLIAISPFDLTIKILVVNKKSTRTKDKSIYLLGSIEKFIEQKVIETNRFLVFVQTAEQNNK